MASQYPPGVSNIPMSMEDAEIMVERNLNLWAAPVIIPKYAERIPERVSFIILFSRFFL